MVVSHTGRVPFGQNRSCASNGSGPRGWLSRARNAPTKWGMFSPERILDRGRLLIGMMIVAPLGALAPAIGRPAPEAPAWSVTATTPNPITVDVPSPRDVLANLTNPTVSGTTAPPALPAITTPTSPSSTQSGVTDALPADATSEVGSESAEPVQSRQIPGSSPDSVLAAQLRQSQSRFAPPASANPAASPPEGPMPVATPLTAYYPTPQGATHIFPIVGGGSFSNDWGGPRPGGRSHQGIDLFATNGTPVVAISDGTLFRVGWNRVGGWRYWLRDGWGNEFYHAHLAGFAPAAREGAVVKAGTVLGYVGTSGDARGTPPHVHFEIHPGGGGPIAPFSYVSAWPRV